MLAECEVSTILGGRVDTTAAWKEIDGDPRNGKTLQGLGDNVIITTPLLHNQHDSQEK
jgi:hypothetical protein